MDRLARQLYQLSDDYLGKSETSVNCVIDVDVLKQLKFKVLEFNSDSVVGVSIQRLGSGSWRTPRLTLGCFQDISDSSQHLYEIELDPDGYFGFGRKVILTGRLGGDESGSRAEYVPLPSSEHSGLISDLLQLMELVGKQTT